MTPQIGRRSAAHSFVSTLGWAGNSGMRLLLSVLVLVFVSSTAFARKPEPVVRLRGRLEPSRVAKGAPQSFWILIGTHKYALDLDPATHAIATKLRGKFVTLVATTDPKGGEAVIVRPHGKSALTAQERAELVGYVRAAPAKQRRQYPYLLETKQGKFDVAARDGRRFKKLLDAYVTVRCYVTSGGGYHRLEEVKAVERTLAPGARAPKKGEQAVAGSWKGSLVADKVPSGVPGVKQGDSFPVSFRCDEKLKNVSGRLMRTYDITETRVRKFSAKKRTIRFELVYSFGQGGYTVTLNGKFSEDFKKLTGKWSSGFLGSGTFELDWSAAKPSRS